MSLRLPLAAALLVVALAPSRATAQPTAVCHPSVTVTLGGDGTATLAATTVDNGSSDASGRPLSLSVTPSGFDCADVDSSPITVTLTVTSSGSSTTCTSQVSVVPPAPTALCQNTTAFLNWNGTVTITEADVDGGSTAACGTPSISATTRSFSCSDVGANLDTLYVSESGVTSMCDAIVTIVDNTMPWITCPGNVTLPPSEEAVVAATLGDLTAADNCFQVSVTNDAPAAGYPFGTTTVTWTATDSSGNTATCQQTVTRDCCMPDLGVADMGPADMGATDMGPEDMGPADMGSTVVDAGSADQGTGGSDQGAGGTDAGAVSDQGAGGTDAGPDADQGADGGRGADQATSPDQGRAIDAGTPPSGGGSGCAVRPGAPTGTAGALGVMLLLGVVVAGRRRR